MLERFFHAWERRLASTTNDRVVRPFEWGLDWISANGDDHLPPEERLRLWVDAVMHDTTGFFHAPPTQAYQFERAPDDRQRRGEAGTLRFASAIATRHTQNNTVVAQWFPSSGEPPIGVASRSRGRAVVVLPQWNSGAEGHIGLSRLLARCGVSALRMSLPYHDERMPPDLTRADFIVSSNVTRTIQVCRQAVLDARRAIAWLAQQGFERIGILGTSLGSCLAMLTTAHEPLVRAQALNHVSPWFADVVWRGISTQHVRASLDGHIDLNRLRELWRPISPFSYLERVRAARTLLVYARYDLTFPIDLSRTLVEEFRARRLAHEVVALPCGHYSTGSVPFKFMDGYVLTRFLRRSL